jgi:purine-binding chemotaxis protein CheW
MSAGGEATGIVRWEELAQRAAQAVGDGVERDELAQLLCFHVDGTPYAVAVESVREIVRICPITPIPRVSRDVRGVISLRGEILQVIDLRLRLGLSRTEVSKASRIVVVHDDEGRVAGLLVDDVKEVLRVPADEIGPAAAGDSQGLVAGLCTRGAAFVSLLDLERALAVHDA